MDYRKLLHIPQKCADRLLNHHLSWLGVAACLPLLGTATAFAVANGAKETEPAAIQQQQVVERLALPEFRFADSQTRYWRDESVQRGDTIARVLSRVGVRGDEVRALLYGDNPQAKSLVKLKVGATLSMQTNDAGELFGLRFLQDDDNGEQILVALEKRDGKWQASNDPVAAESVETVRSINVKRSAVSELAAANVPSDIRSQLAEVFADQFDLASLRAGDRINLVYETMVYAGSPIASGNLLAVSIERQGKLYQAFYFAHDSESGAFYDAAGKPVKKGFSRQPVSGARISSGFGLRKHPILHTLRMHTGIDYAASAGTPIVAPADGEVVKATRENGYGNVVMIRHNAKLATLYAHMRGFAKGMKPGIKVKAGQVIGYVGSTGRSTGAHLHFEVRINDQPVNPATNALPTPGLSRTQLAEFGAKRVQLSAKLNLLQNIPVNVAQID
ncbi:peptidoglycan DD-metalloendopeptidase family protein [Chromobacterium paludis]|uniref:Peptidoglycan DD-metalloendopeptidase family protein n=1 Tax=Chromobacterium paludis TaxID=2605945 RepID=A0A5C1DHS4_9NEIS|nr:peptidoglycan DD-metalloendopeptidase family protein [Chromobacterium paludis]QEL55198.1 peptidoglycan DD-metalloendopeptidase family protein [Chromobacterium paludis]